MEEILEDAKRLREQSVRLLAGVLAGKVVPPPGATKEELIGMLKEDIIGSTKLIERYGWRDDAERT